MGVITPEDPYPVWAAPAARSPSRRCSCCTTTRSCRRASDQGGGAHVALRDGRRLHGRGACCTPTRTRAGRRGAAARVPGPSAGSRSPAGRPTVLVNHFPLVRHPTEVLRYPEFALWCGTERTADWHRRFTRSRPWSTGTCTSPDHLATTGCRFEEVSLGYPREWRKRDGTPGRLRQILPCREPEVIEQLLPTVGRARSRRPRTTPGPELFPEEQALIARAVEKRRREFTVVRGCAAARWTSSVCRPARCPGAGSPAVARRGDRQHDALRGLRRRGAGPASRPGLARHRRGAQLPLPDSVLELVGAARRRAPAGGARRAPPASTGTGSCSAPRSRSTRRGSRSPARSWISWRPT